jgi:hypothetical protein
MVEKARVENEHLYLDSTEAGVSLQLLSSDPPGPPVHFFLTITRHPVHDGVEDIIILKARNLPMVTLTSSTGS